MNSSRNLKRIERFFSRVNVIWQVIGGVLILIVVGNYLLGAAAFVQNYLQTGATSRVDERYKSPVYENDPDRTAYWEEFNKVWSVRFEPYIHYRRNAFQGRFINIDEEGVRRTKKERVAENSKKIFMFGGSTLWGTGAPDDKTIPSFVQAKLGAGFDVYNYGETGYVSAQELNMLLLLLAKGNVPDIVIFYDGVNDGYAGAYSPAIPRDPENMRLRDPRVYPVVLRLIRDSNYQTLFDWLAGKRKFAGWDAKIAPSIERNSAGVIDMYEAHIKQVNSLAAEYGFEAYYFWQPNLFSLTRKYPSTYEQRTIDRSSATLKSSQQAVYRQALERFSGRQREHVYFLGNVFDERKEPIYIDWHHVGPHGNEIIASEMVRSLTSSKSDLAFQPVYE